MIRADQGDIVKVRYTGRLADGTVFDASPPERPLHFILGRQEVIAGFDAAVTGMYQGETKTVAIAPEQAYGPHDPRYVHAIDRGRLPADVELAVGRQLEVTTGEGEQLVLMIVELSDTSVTLDSNHPLAGKTLTFDIELLEVQKRPPI